MAVGGGEVVEHEVAPGLHQPLAGREHFRRDEIEGDELCVGVRKRRAGGAAVVHERGHVLVAGGEERPDPLREDGEHVDRGVLVELCERPPVIGREHHDLVRAG